MEWSTKRKLLYASSLIFFVTAVVVFSLREVIFPSPTCFDNKKNNFEVNIDCGGDCDKKCAEEVIPLTPLFSQAIPLSNGKYDIVALISNANIDNAAKLFSYTFYFYNKEGGLISTLTDSSIQPLDGKFPLFVPDVTLSEAPFKTLVTLATSTHFKVKESPLSPTLRVRDTRFEQDTTVRVTASVFNTKRFELRDIELIAFLYDEKDNVYGVSKTLIPFIGKEDSRKATFVFDANAKKEPTRVVVYPLFDPFKVQE
ncbi:MAG: hypothetical protein RI935_314 [Candidatus Parcubacteria bacterium]|jgi:hypothetical protein